MTFSRPYSCSWYWTRTSLELRLKFHTFWLELELAVDEEWEEYDDECDDDDEYDDTVVEAPVAAGGGALGMLGMCAEGGKLGGGPW